MWAVLGGQATIAGFLLGKGAWVEASDSNDDTALHLAARCAAVAGAVPTHVKKPRSQGTHACCPVALQASAAAFPSDMPRMQLCSPAASGIRAGRIQAAVPTAADTAAEAQVTEQTLYIENSENPLIIATLDIFDHCCRCGSREAVQALLAAAGRGRHPSIKDRNKRGLTPLGEALAAGHAAIAELLVTQVWRACLMCFSVCVSTAHAARVC